MSFFPIIFTYYKPILFSGFIFIIKVFNLFILFIIQQPKTMEEKDISSNLNLFKELMDKVYGECKVILKQCFLIFLPRMKPLLKLGILNFSKKVKVDTYEQMPLVSVIIKLYTVRLLIKNI